MVGPNAELFEIGGLVSRREPKEQVRIVPSPINETLVKTTAFVPDLPCPKVCGSVSGKELDVHLIVLKD